MLSPLNAAFKAGREKRWWGDIKEQIGIFFHRIWKNGRTVVLDAPEISRQLRDPQPCLFMCEGNFLPNFVRDAFQVQWRQRPQRSSQLRIEKDDGHLLEIHTEE